MSLTWPVYRAQELVDEGGLMRLAQGCKCLLKNQAVTQYRKRILYFRYYAKYRRAAPVTHRVINVDPSTVEYVLAPHFQSELTTDRPYIKDGEWDQVKTNESLVFIGHYEDNHTQLGAIPFDNYVLYQSFLDHFNKEVPWKDTELYQWIMDNTHKNIIRYDNNVAINNRFSYLDRLYEDMRKNGYKSQDEINWNSDPGGEILLDIGRDGRFILDDGRHRLAIAKILDFETIPVRVFVRHTEWQRLRYEATTTSPHTATESLQVEPNHPDLEYLD